MSLGNLGKVQPFATQCITVWPTFSILRLHGAASSDHFATITCRIRRPCLCIVPADELSILTHLSPHHVGGIAHIVSPWEGIVRPHFAIPSPAFLSPEGQCVQGRQRNQQKLTTRAYKTSFVENNYCTDLASSQFFAAFYSWRRTET